MWDTPVIWRRTVTAAISELQYILGLRQRQIAVRA